MDDVARSRQQADRRTFSSMSGNLKTTPDRRRSLELPVGHGDCARQLRSLVPWHAMLVVISVDGHINDNVYDPAAWAHP